MKTNTTPLTLAFFIISVLWAASSVWASSIIGALSNFDINNDTGGAEEEFELIISNVPPTEVLGTWNFNPHYGHPTISAIPGGTQIHYASAISNVTPAGGIEHFGVILPSFPTNGVIYSWMRNGTNIGTPMQFPTPVVTIVPVPATQTAPERRAAHREVRNTDPTNTFWVERAENRTNREVRLEELMTTNGVITVATNMDDKPKRLRPGDRLSDDNTISPDDDTQSTVTSLRIYSDNNGKPGPLVGTFMSAAVVLSRSRVEHVRRENDGSSTVSFAVEPGTNYTVHVSNDLLHWTNAGVINTNRSIAQHHDDAATNAPVRYYRLVQQ